MKLVAAVLFSVISVTSFAEECKDAVVLVHGNTGKPSDWNNTYQKLMSDGYYEDQIFRPDWGSKFCPSCNNHSGSEEYPVRDAIEAAVNTSCTGKVDIIGHSMGVTLAAQQIIKLDVANKIDTFVGIAGAWKGLWSCGVYPFNVWSSTCGSSGLSISSPLLDSLENNKIADKVYSMKSYMDEIVCGTGVCLVNGSHSSQIDGEIDSFTYAYGHFGLQLFTSSKQIELINTPAIETTTNTQTSDDSYMTAEEEELYGSYW
ncbi:MAG: lipase [Gammaproteobacteria bacterium]|nr:MAG: lipase [Gammaproteobacteria bacterium]